MYSGAAPKTSRYYLDYRYRDSKNDVNIWQLANLMFIAFYTL